MKDPVREQKVREEYYGLLECEVQFCTSEEPMPIEAGTRAEQDGILWVHDGLEELEESDSGRFVKYSCPNCKYTWWADLGD